MATEQEIAAAKALLEQEGFVLRQTTDKDWKRFGAVVTCNMIAPGLTEKKFVSVIEGTLAYVFANKEQLSTLLGVRIEQKGPLNVKAYNRVQLGLRRKGMEINDG